MTLGYGNVRAALKLGPSPPVNENNEQQREDDCNVMETVWTAPVVPGTDPDTFWNKVYNNDNVENDAEVLREEVVRQARSAMRADLEERKRCPVRQRVEQRLLDAWRRAAAPTVEPQYSLTPGQQQHRTPDPLHSPFPRF